MARGFSKAIIIGNVVRDPETRATTSGSEVTSFSVAVNYNYVMNGEKKEQVSYIEVSAWGKPGNVIAQYAKKVHQSWSQAACLNVLMKIRPVPSVPPWKSLWKTLTYSVADPKNLPQTVTVRLCQILFQMIFQMAKLTSVKYHSNN